MSLTLSPDLTGTVTRQQFENCRSASAGFWRM